MGVCLVKTPMNEPIELYNINLSDCKLIIKYVFIEARSEEVGDHLLQHTPTRIGLSARATLQLFLRRYLRKEEGGEGSRTTDSQEGGKASE